VSATAKTGLLRAQARVRLWFLTLTPVEGGAAKLWINRSPTCLRIDPSVMEAYQPIYTGRPIFEGMLDPVPPWARAVVVDGAVDRVDLALEHAPQRKERTPVMVFNTVKSATPEWMLALAKEDAGKGVWPSEPTELARWVTNKARRAFRSARIGERRHVLNKYAYDFVLLVRRCELSDDDARRLLLDLALEQFDNSDSKYCGHTGVARLIAIINDAFADGAKR
jgi:hypothetical protein